MTASAKPKMRSMAAALPQCRRPTRTGTRWRCFGQQRAEQLEEKHREFIHDIASRTVWREPTEKQGKYLFSLFLKLGGKP